MTTAERLAQVEQAISDVMLAGQSYSIDGQTFQRADLDKLRAYESALKTTLAREQGRSPRVSQADFRYSE